MSKAFTKEDDGNSEPLLPLPDLVLPPGTKNYLTPAGAAALEAKIAAAKLAVDASSKDSRGSLEQRLAMLLRRQECMEVVDPRKQPGDVVLFAATVIVLDEESGRERTYRIVGIDEADAKKGCVSWQSPIARALLGRRVGDVVTFTTPGGEQNWTIVGVVYAAT